jgi:tyrosine-protein kinase Etk/Wzc
MPRKEPLEREELLNGVSTNGVSSGQAILFEQYTLLRKTWLWVLVIALVATIGVGVYVYMFVQPVFMGTVLALPPNKSGTPLDNILGGVASSLKDFGLSRLVGKGSAEAGYDKTVLLTSRPVYDSLIAKYNLDSVYDVPPNRPDITRAMLGENIEVQIVETGPILISVFDHDPQRAANIANDVIYYTNKLAQEMNRRETEPISRYVGQRLEDARGAQVKLEIKLREVMSKNKIFDPEGQGRAVVEEFSTVEANVSAQRILVNALTTSLGADDPRTVQAAELLKEYEAQSRRMVAGKGGVMPRLAFDQVPQAMVEYMRVKLDYETNAKVIALMEPMYEQTRFDEMRSIPILNVFEPAIPPMKKARPRRSVILLSTFAGTFLISYLIIAFAVYFKNFKRRYRYYTSSNGQTPIAEKTVVKEHPYHELPQ